MKDFIWETHGIHMGTFNDHVKHGVDEVEEITELAIKNGAPSITFVIHTPRLTKIRYAAERNTDIKFIRGDIAYNEFPQKVEALKAQYGDKIDIKYGIELEWQGSGLGLQWNKSKIAQVPDCDFVIGSVHFAHEGIPYDGSPEETKELLKLRGGSEAYWAGYIEEMIEMVDTSSDMIQVVGHVDLPKLYVDTPKCLYDIENSNDPLARRFRTLLEMIADRNLALDVNLAGIKKGCGVYPTKEILTYAKKLNIPIVIGTDTHKVDHYSDNYNIGHSYPYEVGYSHYLSFARKVPQKRPLNPANGDEEMYNFLNLGFQIFNRRFAREDRKHLPKLSFGGKFRSLLPTFEGATPLSENDDTIKIRRDQKSITMSDSLPSYEKEFINGIYTKHIDKPGILSILFNTLASEEINVETAKLTTNSDGTASAFLTVSGDESAIKEAIEFIKGTAKDAYIEIDYKENIELPKNSASTDYITAIDGVEMTVPINKEMIFTKHLNKTGVLLELLSALASKNINIHELQLGERGNFGYSVIGVEGDRTTIARVIRKLSDSFLEASHIVLHDYK